MSDIPIQENPAPTSTDEHDKYVKSLEQLVATVANLFPGHDKFIAAGRTTSAYVFHLRPVFNAIKEAFDNIPPKPQVQTSPLPLEGSSLSSRFSPHNFEVGRDGTPVDEEHHE